MQQKSIEPLHQHWGTLEQESGLSGLTSIIIIIIIIIIIWSWVAYDPEE